LTDRLESYFKGGLNVKALRTIIFLPVLFVLILSNALWSANWVEYDASSQGDVYSYNKSSVKLVTADIIQVWQRYDFARAVKGVKSTTVLRQIDCQLNRSKVLSVIDYDLYGGVLHNNTNEDTDWKDIPPNSRLDELRKILCE